MFHSYKDIMVACNFYLVGTSTPGQMDGSGMSYKTNIFICKRCLEFWCTDVGAV